MGHTKNVFENSNRASWRRSPGVLVNSLTCPLYIGCTLRDHLSNPCPVGINFQIASKEQLSSGGLEHG